MKPLETYERCVICDWFELDPFNVAPHKRHVVDGVCHVCRGAIQSTLHTPSLDLPDPFEGAIGGALGVEDLSLPPGMPLEDLRMAVHGDFNLEQGKIHENNHRPTHRMEALGDRVGLLPSTEKCRSFKEMEGACVEDSEKI